jgi:hypothetical protein
MCTVIFDEEKGHHNDGIYTPLENIDFAHMDQEEANRIVFDALDRFEEGVSLLKHLLNSEEEVVMIAALEAFLNRHGGRYTYDLNGRPIRGLDVFSSTAYTPDWKVEQDMIEGLFDASFGALLRLGDRELSNSYLDRILRYRYERQIDKVREERILLSLATNLANQQNLSRHGYPLAILVDRYFKICYQVKNDFKANNAEPYLLVERFIEDSTADDLSEWIGLIKKVCKEETSDWVINFTK